MQSLLTFFKDFVVPLITVVTGVLVTILNISVSNVESQLKVSQEQRAERESFQSMDLKIYEKVVASLESNDPKKQQVAQALVVVMASDSFRTKLLNILQQTATDSVQKEVDRIIKKENQFKIEERSVQQTNNLALKNDDWLNYSYDIFWCEKSGEQAKESAEEIVRQLKEKGVNGQLRVRQLPESINARQGYQISGNIVRANSDETKVAQELAKIASSILNQEVIVTRSSQSTPNYLSMFICQ